MWLNAILDNSVACGDCEAYSSFRTQTRMIRTRATGCLVPILFVVEIRFHQPKQHLTVSLVFVVEQWVPRRKKIASIELRTSVLGTKGCVVTHYCKLQVFGIDLVEIEVGKSKGYILINESIAQGNLIDWWVIYDTSSCVHFKAWNSYEI